ncbi:secretin and TonB N-terminal domain-containing protein [Rhodopseudomonas sp. P2A-2r]|uniref:secretin and TonB N-terminal domain-containing protein n=1 Tax=Rhodopseudomonas sp. P2A-2r TaxID=2991972 RepID=UPI0022342E66|nr:secretin and TonB N-terminal domain-containing protein [Rhodopseudomonas sp. P2A-2r]UZE50510.1 secretin and TonB N-terminal domain-containing protein [Rhodopseudomonas sp. P2A-2r]
MILTKEFWKSRRIAMCLVAWGAILNPVLVCNADSIEKQRKQLATNVTTDAVSFDIPSGLLEDALIAYAEMTGVEVFVEHALAAGQYSSPLQGEYSAEAALRALLAGTGLQIRRAAERAYTVVAPGMQEPATGRAPSWGVTASA